MKTVQDIIGRIVALMTYTDMCALESAMTSGHSEPLETRQQHKKAIYKWLIKNGCFHYLTNTEKAMFEREIRNTPNMNILKNTNQYEAVQPLLWCVGLINNLSSYNGFVEDEFYNIIGIGDNYNYHELLSRCTIRDPIEMNAVYVNSMVWYWRTWLCSHFDYSEEKLLDVIRNTYGLACSDAIKSKGIVNNRTIDFKFKNKWINNLTEYEKDCLKEISKWRFYAFRWALSDFTWDNVVLNIDIDAILQ